jgi:hypothetical protein
VCQNVTPATVVQGGRDALRVIARTAITGDDAQ